MKKTKNAVVRFTVYTLLILFLIAIINMQIKIRLRADEITKLERDIIALEDDIAERRILLSEEKTPDYYARVAREKLNYHFPNEIIFINDAQ